MNGERDSISTISSSGYSFLFLRSSTLFPTVTPIQFYILSFSQSIHSFAFFLLFLSEFQYIPQIFSLLIPFSPLPPWDNPRILQILRTLAAMHDTPHLKSQRRRRHWCCSFTTPPLSPENPAALSHSCSLRSHSSSCSKKAQLPFSNSPHTQRTPFARRILSPGRVSPFSEHAVAAHAATTKKYPIPKSPSPPPSPPLPPPVDSGIDVASKKKLRFYDTRLKLKGKNGGSMVLELRSEVLAANSPVFADLIADYGKNLSGLCRVEVPDVENLIVFRETIELMFEEDIHKKLVKIGVFRAIEILEVAACIKFGRCISACLKYLEAVPWTEEEEEKLRDLFNSLNIDDPKAKDILDRFCSLSPIESQPTLTKQLIWSITNCNDATAGNELKSLVKGLLCKSSVYAKDNPDVNKEDIYTVCESCLESLSSLLEETSGTVVGQKSTNKKEKEKPLLERLSKQVDNINWLIDILLDHEMAEEFIHLWANQELLKLHENASPMVKYELSRVSALLFIAIGTRRFHCPPEARLRLLQAWFRPMLSDFGWLQRSKKGLDMKALEEAMGQVLLTLPLKEQYSLFMEWFRCFSKNGTECPNLSKAFQIWWRRSFLRGSEILAIESR